MLRQFEQTLQLQLRSSQRPHPESAAIEAFGAGIGTSACSSKGQNHEITPNLDVVSYAVSHDPCWHSSTLNAGKLEMASVQCKQSSGCGSTVQSPKFPECVTISTSCTKHHKTITMLAIHNRFHVCAEACASLRVCAGKDLQYTQSRLHQSLNCLSLESKSLVTCDGSRFIFRCLRSMCIFASLLLAS